MDKLVNLIGQRFGNLIVISFEGSDKRRFKTWKCVCDCGREKTIRGSHLLSGNNRSCGCLSLKSVTKHGMTKSLTYSSWRSMIYRCTNPKSVVYKHYGERGIKVCERWLNFEDFYSDMGERESILFSLDRIDVNGNYEPENCRWATKYEQSCNKRTSAKNKAGKNGVRWVESLKKWEARINVNKKQLYLGAYPTKKEAINVREEAEQKYWRESS